MAAFQVGTDGNVIPPLNITQPAPSMNLRGFKWGTVTDDIHISPANPGHGVDPSPSKPTHKEQPLAEQAVLLQEAPSFRVAGDTAPALEAAIPASSQLAEQLRRKDAPEKDVGPSFPLKQFQGAYAGNGFNLIFRPKKFSGDKPKVIDASSAEQFQDFGDKTVSASEGINDNILQLSITLEQLTFGAPIGNIPNRGFKDQDDINLFGVPYLQTVQDTTGLGLENNPNKTDIHFETGMWLNVPAAKFQNKQASVVRMASIPHGTTINAQGFSPQEKPSPQSVIGGEKGAPNFDLKENQVDARPFVIGKPGSLNGATPTDDATLKKFFPNMDVENKKSFRIPQDLKGLASSGKVTSALIRNPNLYLKTAIKDLNITETITFEVHTGPGPGPPEPKLNGGGTANIAFLAGLQNPITTAAPSVTSPMNAHAISTVVKYWVERVLYKVPVGPLKPFEEMKDPVMAQLPANSTAPTPKFIIKAGPSGVPNKTVIDVPGIQIQSSQNVILNFGGLSWPHVSVSTLVPTEPQRFPMEK